MFHNIKAIVFDFDGVLAESVSAKGDAFYALYEHEGKAIQDQVLSYHLAHGGVSRFDKIRYFEETLLGCSINDETVNIIADRFGALVEEKVVQSEWVKGAKDYLEHIHTRCTLYVASATPQQELERIIEKRGMTSYFRAIYGSPIKKADHIRSLMTKDNLIPQDIVMIGDTMSDYNAAHDTGIHFLGRIETKGKNPFPQGTSLIDDLSECPKWIKF